MANFFNFDTDNKSFKIDLDKVVSIEFNTIEYYPGSTRGEAEIFIKYIHGSQTIGFKKKKYGKEIYEQMTIAWENKR